MKKENFNKAKEIAISFLEKEIRTRKLFHGHKSRDICIDHPFIRNRYISFSDENDGENFVYHDILSDDAAKQELILCYRNAIEKSENINDILSLIAKPYRLQFLRTLRNVVPPEEMETI